MFPTEDYTPAALDEWLVGKEEISQENNPNAYTRLFITDRQRVTKLFVDQPELTRQNLCNLRLLQNHAALKAIPALVMPLSLFCLEGRPIGYTMPYIPGRTLTDYLADPSLGRTGQLDVLAQLAEVICALPEDVFIGDLHGENVLVDPIGRIHLIDIDGFSLRDGFQLTVPRLAPDIPGKYVEQNGRPMVNRDSDIYCFYHLFLCWLAGNSYVMTEYYFPRYIRYLERQDFPPSLISHMEKLTAPGKNLLDARAIRKINPNSHYLSFQTFLEETGLLSREKQAEKILDRYLSPKTGRRGKHGKKH